MRERAGGVAHQRPGDMTWLQETVRGGRAPATPKKRPRDVSEGQLVGVAHQRPRGTSEGQSTGGA
eukprot:621983-Rhodomonas_salina.1